MSRSAPQANERRRRLHLAPLLLLLGLVLFVLLLVGLDIGEVVARVRSAAWVVLPSFCLLALSQLSASLCWHETLIGGSRPPLPLLLSAHWAGYSLNVLVPGGAAGAVLRGTLVRQGVEDDRIVSSIVVHTYLKLTTAFVFTVAGPLVALLVLDLPTWVPLGMLGASVLLGLLVLGARIQLRRGVASRLLAASARLPGLRRWAADSRRLAASRIDARLRDFGDRYPVSLRRAVLWATLSRLLIVVEAFVLLSATVPNLSLGTAVAFALLVQTGLRIIVWLAPLVPARIGLNEGGVALLFGLAALDPVSGLAFVLLRRLRQVASVGVGLVLGVVLQRRRVSRWGS